MAVLGYDSTAATIFERLRRQRLSIDTMDAKITSIVLANNAILITRNLVDFRRIADLEIEDWSLDGER